MCHWPSLLVGTRSRSVTVNIVRFPVGGKIKSMSCLIKKLSAVNRMLCIKILFFSFFEMLCLFIQGYLQIADTRWRSELSLPQMALGLWGRQRL